MLVGCSLGLLQMLAWHSIDVIWTFDRVSFNRVSCDFPWIFGDWIGLGVRVRLELGQKGLHL